MSLETLCAIQFLQALAGSNPMTVLLSCTQGKKQQASPWEVCTQNIVKMNGSQAPSPYSIHFFLSFSLLSLNFYLIFFLTISLNFSNTFFYLNTYMPTEMIVASVGRKTHHSTIFLKALLKNNPLLSNDSQDSVLCTYNLIL